MKKQLKQPLPEKLLDKSIPLKDRLIMKEEADKKMMNPFETFDPDNFEPLATEAEKELATRKRAKPPKNLPTFGIKPKPVREGQMIGMYESKQDLYLIFAWRCNELQEEIDLLKEEIKKLKGE